MPGPALKISVSRKTARGAPREKPIPILVVWENDGRLSGAIEKGVRLFVEVTINGERRRGEITAGRDGQHWINVIDNRESNPREARSNGAGAPADDDVDAGDF